MTGRSPGPRALALATVPIVAAAGIGAVGPGASAADPAVGWRYDGTGVYPSADPPTRWSPTENVVWKVKLPAWGNASPVVDDERIFVTAEPVSLLAFSRDDGKLLWSAGNPVLSALRGEALEKASSEVAEADRLARALEARQEELSRRKRDLRKSGGDSVESQALLVALTAEVDAIRDALERTARYRTPPTNDIIGYASSTPVSDGQRVFALFGNGVVAGYSVSGERLWSRYLGRSGRMNGHLEGTAASLLLVDGKLVVPYAELQALDPRTGDVLWRAGEYRDYGTPAAVSAGGERRIVTPDGRVVRAKDGAVLAKGVFMDFYTSLVPAGDRVLVAGATTDDAGAAAAKARIVGLAAPFATPWTADLGPRRIHASPLLAGDVVFAVNDLSDLVALDAGTGAVVFRERLPLDQPKPSPSAAGPYVFLYDESGRTLVLRRGRTFEQVADNLLEPFRATPFHVDGQLYVRGHDHLWRIGR